MSILLIISGVLLIISAFGTSEDFIITLIMCAMGILNIAAAVRIRRYRRELIALKGSDAFKRKCSRKATPAAPVRTPVPAAPVPAAPKSEPSKPSVDDMTGIQFEDFCARILEGYGFCNISKTPTTGDHGIDLIAWKSGKKYAIQCKRYKGNVGNKAIQEAYTGKQLYAAAEAVVMTSSDFTNQAKKEAEEVGVDLWNRDSIKHIMGMAGIDDVRI